MDITKYIISDTQYLKMNVECIHDDECKTCAHIDIDYVDEKNNTCIRFGYEVASSFCYFLVESGCIQRLLNGEMILSQSITNDLGFEMNQYVEGIQKSDDCFDYLLFSNSHKQIRPYFNSWMYNDIDGNIIFEITPFYPSHGKTKKAFPEKISYKEFMKNYQLIVKTIIPKENLEQWIKQAQELKKR